VTFIANPSDPDLRHAENAAGNRGDNPEFKAALLKSGGTAR
jgi:hypothetical protein